MKKISKKAFHELTTDSTVIESDWFGPKVLKLAEGNYLKFFRVKRLFSSARIFPYAKRFALNVEKLDELEIPTVEVKSFFTIAFIKKAAVLYAPLEGETLRSKQVELNESLCYQLGQFITTLHNKGVYFRSLHLGNIVLTPAGDLGLIDIADMKFYDKPLPPRLRQRNLKHLFRYQQDLNPIKLHLSAFIDGYQSNNPKRFAIEPLLI